MAHKQKPVFSVHTDADGNWAVDMLRPAKLTAASKKTGGSKAASYRRWRSLHEIQRSRHARRLDRKKKQLLKKKRKSKRETGHRKSQSNPNSGDELGDFDEDEEDDDFAQTAHEQERAEAASIIRELIEERKGMDERIKTLLERLEAEIARSQELETRLAVAEEAMNNGWNGDQARQGARMRAVIRQLESDVRKKDAKVALLEERLHKQRR